MCRRQEDSYYDDGHGLQPLGGKTDDVSVVAYKVPYPSESSSQHEAGSSVVREELILEAGARQVFGRDRRSWMAQPEVRLVLPSAVDTSECWIGNVACLGSLGSTQLLWWQHIPAVIPHSVPGCGCLSMLRYSITCLTCNVEELSLLQVAVATSLRAVLPSLSCPSC